MGLHKSANKFYILSRAQGKKARIFQVLGNFAGIDFLLYHDFNKNKIMLIVETLTF